ncbi:MAG: D-alanine--D-alanine ligase family protein [Anaerolineales bacterium]
MPGLKVALLANLKKNAPKFPGMTEDHWDDLDSEKTVDALLAAIRAGGHACVFHEGDAELYNKLRDNRPDICFNICEGHFGDGREAQVPALLEMMRIPYTGSRVLTLALALDKPMTKRVLMWHDLTTPAFQSFESPDEPLDDDMTFPLFVKPSREGTGMGVSARSIVNTEAELREQLEYILNRYKQTALVERFIAGREVTVGLVGNVSGVVARRLPSRFYTTKDRDYSEAGLAALKAGGITFLPPLEINLQAYEETDAVYSNRLKTDLADQLDYMCPAPLDGPQVQELNWLTAAVFRVMECHDVSRVDFRLDEHDHDKPYILEINPLPGLAPVISDLVIEAEALHISHTELVNMILEAAIARYGLVSGRFISTP